MIPLNNTLNSYIENLKPQISAERQKTLSPLIDYLQKKVDSSLPINLVFICTHNSRRSHLAQVWGETLAAYHQIKQTHCYSAGTESTALYPEAAAALERAGFEIQALSKGENPVYSIKYSSDQPAIIGFSKAFDHSFNPQNQFAALMVCTDAEENCPFIPGAELRIPISYNDPKAFDNTPQKSEKYDERCLEIARELDFVFSALSLR